MILLRAKYIIPNSSIQLENGAVAIHKSKIAAVDNYHFIRRNYPAAEVVDLGESAILPGLVNAHTHLELTKVADKIKRTQRFTDWIRQVIDLSHDEAWNEASVCEATKLGVEMCLQSGTTTVGDIANSNWSVSPLFQSRIRKVVFCEATGINKIRAERSLSRLNGVLNEIKVKSSSLMKLGISPHAPYSTSPELYKECAKIAISRRIPLATHISETKSEVEFLRSGSGEFRELLEERQIDIGGWKPPNRSPIEYLNDLGILRLQPLLIHGNYLTSKDIELIKASKSNLLFCPRSHEYFQHKDHPFQKLMAAGVNVALGTDSLASNWSLSLLDEIRYLYDKHKIAPKTLFDMATINGAKALGLQEKIGTLQAGKESDIISINIKANGDDLEKAKLLEAIMAESAKANFVMIAGQILREVQQ